MGGINRTIGVATALAMLVWLPCISIAADPTTLPADKAIDAAALIIEAKQSQDWLSHVKSFRVRFDREDPATTRGFANADGATGSRASSTRPTPKLIHLTEIAFDERRLYTAIELPSSFVTVRFWDGELAGFNGHDGYYELSDSSENVKDSFMTSVTWGRNGQAYWWSASRRTQDDLIGPVDGYRYVGTQRLNSVECYTFRRNGSPASECYVGVTDHQLYGWCRASQISWYADYKEVAPGCWYPMTQGEGDRVALGGGRGDSFTTEGTVLRVKEVAVNKPLPEQFFKQDIKDGTYVHETRGGKTLIYVKTATRAPEEVAEMAADAARRKLYGPPPMPPGSVLLNAPVEPLPLNPLIFHPAAEFPEQVRWLNGGPVKLADYRGKVVLIVFWATWAEFTDDFWARTQSPPDLKLLASIKQDVVVVGVHVPTVDTARVERAIQKLGIEFPVCIDVPLNGQADAWGQLADQYRVDRLSVTYVIDPEGKVATLGSWPVAVRRAGELLGKATGK